jgi:hypothetical protein
MIESPSPTGGPERPLARVTPLIEDEEAIAELEEAVRRLPEARERILHAAERRLADRRAS